MKKKRKLENREVKKKNLIMEHRNIFEKCWLNFLKFNLPKSIHKQILANLEENILPHLKHPIMLMDYLTDSYNAGGISSILSLSGLFVLITKHNLDFPDFYKKLYALFDNTIFLVKYRAKFFKLVYTFLSSTHLPAYLVAAFIKRLARLSLEASPSGIMIILPLIFNLMKRHPATQVLVHRPAKVNILMLNNDSANAGKDPFDFYELNPEKCNALDSSLWEIELLKQHYHPSVSRLTKIFDKLNGARQEYDLDPFISLSFQSEFDASIKKKQSALAFQRQPFLGENDLLSKLWDLS